MRVLQDALERVISKSIYGLAARAINEQLRSKGIRLTKAQVSQLADRLSNAVVTESERVDSKHSPSLEVDLGSIDLELLDSRVHQVLTSVAQEIAGKTIPWITPKILRTLKQTAPEMLSDRARLQQDLERRLRRRWGKPLDSLEMLLAIALEAGDDFNSEYSSSVPAEQNQLFEVLRRLHARSCQVSAEILSLLKSGFADGAHARWRSLHEIAVIAEFIRAHGNELARRYLRYQAVEAYRKKELYTKYCDQLGYPPLSEEETTAIDAQYGSALREFGKEFGKRYGWANQFVAGQPTFQSLEEGARQAKWRPFYDMACDNVHAGPNAIMFRLGLPSQWRNLLPAGPSVFGLADPGHCAAISLTQATICFLSLNGNLDRLVTCRIMLELSDQIGDAFLKVHQRLESKLKEALPS